MLSVETQSTILTNGNIYLFDDPFTQVESLAISNGRITAAGLDRDVLALAKHATRVIKLKGRTVLPGLIDAHVHIQGLSRHLSTIDCETKTIEECLQRIKNKVDETAPGKWILGRGWNQNPWGRFGTKEDLDTITSQHPIYLVAKSGHAAWTNSFALSMAGIADKVNTIEGGEIKLDSQGNPSGILLENAMDLVSDIIPPMTIDEFLERILIVQDRLWSMGLTGFHDFDGPNAFSALQRLYDSQQLWMRVLKNIPLSQLENIRALGLRSGFGNDWLRIGNIKIFADGALGPQTAAMLDPYSGRGEERGILLIQVEDLAEIIMIAAEHGLASSIHAIGDHANRVVLDAYDKVRKLEKTKHLPVLRHRIEHLQLLHPDDLDRLAKLNIIASMQPIHATSDMLIADQYWGSRSRYSYAWRSQLNSGTRLIFGSDAPVESPNPFLGLYAAITRRRLDGTPGENGWIPEERINLREAFFAYTRGPAYAAGLEMELGCLLPGYLADLIVLDQDPFRCPPEELPYLTPIATMTGGEWRIQNL
jgi:predicted amidohydrolase YtcJ